MTQSEKNRDAGIARVLESNSAWQIKAEALLRKICKERKNQKVTGEDIRYVLTDLGVEPQHPNAWGGLINGLIKQKVLKPTNLYQSMQDPRSHARKTRVYIIKGFVEKTDG